MAKNITVQVAGGARQTFDDVNTVREAAAKVGASDGYTASINGDPAEMDDELDDYNFVSFAKAVKGGC